MPNSFKSFNRNDEDEQEIFMYDIATKAVSKLNGELSSAFVRVAESNASAQDLDGAQIMDSGIIEQMVNKNATSEEEITTTILPERDEMDMEDSDFEGSENVESVVKFEEAAPLAKGEPAKKSLENKVMISSGYSVIKS